MKVGRSVPWRIESTGELGQGLFFVIPVDHFLLGIATEGCTAGIWRGLLETNCVGTLCERVSRVE